MDKSSDIHDNSTNSDEMNIEPRECITRQESRQSKPRKIKVIIGDSRPSDQTSSDMPSKSPQITENAPQNEDDMSADTDGLSTSSETMSSDDLCMSELARTRSLKAPDQVQDIVSEWGRGNQCEILWNFRYGEEIFYSVGEVVSRVSRKGQVRIKIAYSPAEGQTGPQGNLFLPQSDKVRVFQICATKINRIPSKGVNTLNFPESMSETTKESDTHRDMEPLPPLAQIEPSFAVHVVSIFRETIREYPRLQLLSEKETLWHRFLNAPRDALTTVRKMLMRTRATTH